LGDHWPPYDDRREMLVEAIEVMRGLWDGELFSYRGDFYVVENARIYDAPRRPLPIMVAAGGPESAAAAGEFGDGLIVTSPKRENLDVFRSQGGSDKPIFGQVTVCWAASDDEATRTLHRIWPTAGVPGDLSQELPLPRHFEDASRLVSPESLVEHTPVGPNPERYIDAVRECVDAGVQNVYIHQVGPDQEGFFHFFEKELQPELARLSEREPVAV
jgi:G6PDH family F420-dependent oxidoreductase